MKNTQKIRCSIKSCRHNERGCDCLLNSVEINPCPECGCDDVTSCNESLCSSFEVR